MEITVCTISHGRESAIPSLWCPRLRDYVREYLKKFAEHYLPQDVLESVNLGITGDYGEAIYSVIGNWPGEYHSHGAVSGAGTRSPWRTSGAR